MVGTGGDGGGRSGASFSSVSSISMRSAPGASESSTAQSRSASERSCPNSAARAGSGSIRAILRAGRSTSHPFESQALKGFTGHSGNRQDLSGPIRVGDRYHDARPGRPRGFAQVLRKRRRYERLISRTGDVQAWLRGRQTGGLSGGPVVSDVTLAAAGHHSTTIPDSATSLRGSEKPLALAGP